MFPIYLLLIALIDSSCCSSLYIQSVLSFSSCSSYLSSSLYILLLLDLPLPYLFASSSSLSSMCISIQFLTHYSLMAGLFLLNFPLLIYLFIPYFIFLVPVFYVFIPLLRFLRVFCFLSCSFYHIPYTFQPSDNLDRWFFLLLFFIYLFISFNFYLFFAFFRVSSYLSSSLYVVILLDLPNSYLLLILRFVLYFFVTSSLYIYLW